MFFDPNLNHSQRFFIIEMLGMQKMPQTDEQHQIG